ncbi:MAG TPA: low affinity iron permease family protein [Verrucomicrobiae bacterium]|nr:low affinity iron permease family protein [Verrucomicrobiae bacterium]
MRNNAGNKLDKSSRTSQIQDWFRHFAHRMARLMGSPWSFFIAILTVIVWGITGPLFHFSNSWQLVINTGTTIITFLMVFLIQNTQNRDAWAFDLKLDELIRAAKGARNEMLNLEGLSDEELAELKQEYDRICQRAKP